MRKRAKRIAGFLVAILMSACLSASSGSLKSFGVVPSLQEEEEDPQTKSKHKAQKAIDWLEKIEPEAASLLVETNQMMRKLGEYIEKLKNRSGFEYVEKAIQLREDAENLQQKAYEISGELSSYFNSTEAAQQKIILGQLRAHILTIDNEEPLQNKCARIAGRMLETQREKERLQAISQSGTRAAARMANNDLITVTYNYNLAVEANQSCQRDLERTTKVRASSAREINVQISLLATALQNARDSFGRVKTEYERIESEFGKLQQTKLK